MKIITKLLLLQLILVLSCCQSKQKDEKIDLYTSEFKLLKKNLKPDHKILQDGIYYLIYADSCEPCVFSNLNMLQELPDNLENFIPVILGKTNKINVEPLFNDIIYGKFDKGMFIEDFSIHKYKLDVTKPLLLHFKSNELIYVNNFNDFELQQAKDYIISNLKK